MGNFLEVKLSSIRRDYSIYQDMDAPCDDWAFIEIDDGKGFLLALGKDDARVLMQALDAFVTQGVLVI